MNLEKIIDHFNETCIVFLMLYYGNFVIDKGSQQKNIFTAKVSNTFPFTGKTRK